MKLKRLPLPVAGSSPFTVMTNIFDTEFSENSIVFPEKSNKVSFVKCRSKIEAILLTNQEYHYQRHQSLQLVKVRF